MAIEIIDTLAPKNSGTFPLVEASKVKGGRRTVADVAALDSIPAAHREAGMEVWVEAAQRSYRLATNLTTWVLPSPIADWAPDTVRFFMVSSVTGSDSNRGWADGAPDASLAIRTWTRLLEILPRDGGGRTAVVLVEGAITDFAMMGFTGYGHLIIRGTGDVPTAGAVRFSNTTADKIACGAVPAPGASATGYRLAFSAVTITAATATSPIECTAAAHGLATGDKIMVFAGAANGTIDLHGVQTITVTGPDTFTCDGTVGRGTFTGTCAAHRWKLTAVDASPVAFTDDMVSAADSLLGFRVRFAYNTTTAALRNRSFGIIASGLDTIVPPQSPHLFGMVGTDTLYIEQPGVSVWSQYLMFDLYNVNDMKMSVAGLRTGDLYTQDTRGLDYTLCFNAHQYSNGEGFGHVLYDCDSAYFSSTFTDESLGYRNLGYGSRFEGGGNGSCFNVYDTREVTGMIAVVFSSFSAWDVPQCEFSGVGSLDFYSSFFGSGLTVDAGEYASIGSVDYAYGNGITRVNKGGIVGAGRGRLVLGGVQITNCAADGSTQNAVELGAECSVALLGVYGTRGNPRFGLLMGPESGGSKGGGESVVKLTAITWTAQPPVTVAGALGDVALCVPVDSFGVVPWENIAKQNFRDGYMNSIVAASADPLVAMSAPMSYSAGATDVLAYRICKVSGQRTVDHAQADSAANATGVVCVAQNGTALASSLAGIVGIGSGQTFIEFDTSGGKAAPAVGDMAYLSPDTAGMAQTVTPAVAGTNQKLRLGRVVAIDTSRPAVAVVDFRPELLPSAADGNP
jgi:hypothetical protein